MHDEMSRFATNLGCMHAFDHILGYILGLNPLSLSCIIYTGNRINFLFSFLGEVELVDLLYTAQIHPMA